MSKIIDYRCPKCDRPVKGTHDVVTVKRLPRREPQHCQHCKSGVMLTRSADEPGFDVPVYHFVYVPCA